MNARDRRHAIILISDNGHDLFGVHDVKQCYVELMETGTTLYNLRIPSNYDDRDIQRMVKDTGGDEVGADGQATMKEGLEDLITQLRMQYTIGFNPSNAGRRGDFHKLEVKFANPARCPDCPLLVRGGYYSGITPPPRQKAKPLQAYDQQTDEALVKRGIMIAGTTYLDLNEIPIEVKVDKQTDSDGQPQIQVDVNIDAEAVEFSETGDLRACKLKVALFFADEKGNGIDSKLWGIDRSVKEDAYEKLVEDGIPFSQKVTLKVNPHQLRVVVYDVKSDKVSSRRITLIAPPMGKKPPKK